MFAQLALPHEGNSLCVEPALAVNADKLQNRTTSLDDLLVVAATEQDFEHFVLMDPVNNVFCGQKLAWLDFRLFGVFA